MSRHDDPELIRKLLKELRLAQQEASIHEERLDRIVGALEMLSGDLAKEAAKNLPRVRATLPAVIQLIREDLEGSMEAANGVRHISFRILNRRKMAVWIDGRPVVLPSKLARLIKLLADDTGPSPDDFVAWKSRSEIRKVLAPSSKKPVRDQTLNQLVYRLRKELRIQAKLHRAFVQTDPDQGLRFVIKRSSAPREPMVV